MLPSEQFARLRGKYPRMPEWNWLARNFRLKIEDEGNTLEQVRASVSEKLDAIARNTIEPIIAGGESYCCYFERKMLTEEQKEELWGIYRQLQSLLWRSNALNIDFSEREVADWLADVKQLLENVKPKLLAACGRLAKGWLSYKKGTEETAYHG